VKLSRVGQFPAVEITSDAYHRVHWRIHIKVRFGCLKTVLS